MMLFREFSNAPSEWTWHPAARTGSFPLPDVFRKARILNDWSVCIREIAERRDRAQFQSLFLHFSPRLKSFFLRAGGESTLAEDLAQ